MLAVRMSRHRQHIGSVHCEGNEGVGGVDSGGVEFSQQEICCAQQGLQRDLNH